MDMEQQIAELRRRPLLVLCKTPKWKEQVMTVAECRRTGSRYIHVVVDELDQLLAAELGENSQKFDHKKGIINPAFPTP